MSVPQIILTVVAAVLIGIAAAMYITYRSMNKRAEKFTIVGRVVGWQDGKIPGLGREIIQYTRKGKPYQCASGVMRRKKMPRIGTGGMWVVHKIPVKDGTSIMVAKKPEKPEKAN